MAQPLRDPTPLERLTPREMLDIVRGFIGRTLASSRADDQHVGMALHAFLRGEGRLDALLGIKPRRGSHARPEAIIEAEQTRRLLVDFAREVGSDVKAAAILSGTLPVPPALIDLAAELHRRQAPASRRSITRARCAMRKGQ